MFLLFRTLLCWYFTISQQSGFVLANSAWCYIISEQTGLVLDIKGGRKTGDLIMNSIISGRPSQLWRFDRSGAIRNRMGSVVDIYQANKNQGTKLIAYPYHGGRNQKWVVGRNYTISRLNGMLMDVYQARTKKGTKVIVWPKHGSKNQRWKNYCP